MPDPVQLLREQGQSVWLDYISRDLLTTGGLKDLVAKGWIRGVTSNPTIFQKSVASGDDYDAQLGRLAGRNVSAYDAFVEIGSEDIRNAADVLRPVYDASGYADGFVSFEAQAAGTEAMIDEAHRMWRAVDRPNLMIKIPGVQAGVKAVEQLIADGVNVNITLLFGVDVYKQFAEAYMAGLERRLDAGLAVDRMASVASFFVSRVDTKVDEMLPEGSPLRGKVAIANAYAAYDLFLQMTASERWQRLAAAGARVQRPLWASTGTKNPAYSDVMYVDAFVGRDTVNTLPEATLNAFADHGRPVNALDEGVKGYQRILDDARAAGIDLKRVADELLDAGLEAFDKDFEKLLGEIEKKMVSSPAVASGDSLGSLQAPVTNRLQKLRDDNVIRRVWAQDHTVWGSDPTEITSPNRMGWLTVIDTIESQLDDLKRFADEVRAGGIEQLVVLGMGGSSLAPEVFSRVFGPALGYPRLTVLDTTVPAEVIELEQSLDLQKTLFVVASKSGTTLETTSHLAYFWSRIPDGKHFIAITDPGTKLEAEARAKNFRRVFLAPDSIGGRYSALSHFGLVPAALIGVDVAALLDRACRMQQACESEDVSQNPGALLGAAIGEAALHGQDKLTLILPERYSSAGTWLEQLLAESTGKQGKGVVPIDGEPLCQPSAYGADRLFVAYREDERIDALVAAGHPVVRLRMDEPLDLGAEFYRWEFATAIAGHVLGINPFDQPNVQQAKDAAAAVLAGRPANGTRRNVSLADLKLQLRPGDYLTLQAYLPRDEGLHARLSDVRRRMMARYGVATSLQFGPRYLHSTGQVHKGGPNSGVFLQIVDPVEQDMPIPGQAYSFGTLMRAQADGDLMALGENGRRATRLTLTELEEAMK
jgi:transaldolase/glucose-6-phosphate isomerase